MDAEAISHFESADGPTAELLTSGYWERVFATEDPWDYASSNYERWKFEQTLAVLPQQRIVRAVELGCAEGYFTEQIAARVERLLAVDLSPTAVDRARVRCAALPNVHFRVGNLATDPLPSALDLVVCSEVLFYLTHERVKDVAARIAAALRPGGLVLLAHANLVSDDPDHTGFDWGHAFGARTIGALFAATSGLDLIHEVKSPLFTIQLFRRADPHRATPTPQRQVLPLPPDLALTAKVERFVIWNGAVTTRAAASVEQACSVPILMYHSIADSGPEELAPYRVTPAVFANQMRYLRRHGYHSVSLETWADCLAEGRPLRGRPIIITFDDGYQDFVDQAWPILERADFSASLFVVTDKVGGVASWDTHVAKPVQLADWDALRSLAAQAVTIGSHTATHPDLDQVSLDEVRTEAARSREALRAQLGQDTAVIAFPWGRAEQPVRATLSACGYTIGLSTRPGISTLGDDPLNLPRIEVCGDMTLDQFAGLLAPAPTVGFEDNETMSPLLEFDDPDAMEDFWDEPVGFNDAPPVSNQAASPPSVADSTPHPSPSVVDRVDRLTAALSPTDGLAAPHPIHPRYAHALSARLDRLVNEFVQLQTQLLAACGRGPSLAAKLLALFTQPVTGTVRQTVRRGAEITPGVSFGFEDGADVRFGSIPKTDHAASPATHLNAAEIAFTGPSDYLSLEIELDWSDIAAAQRVQASLYGICTRSMTVYGILRLPNHTGVAPDILLATLQLQVGDRAAFAASDLSLPDFVTLDTSRRPRLVLYFDTTGDFTLTLDCLALYFA